MVLCYIIGRYPIGFIPILNLEEGQYSQHAGGMN